MTDEEKDFVNRLKDFDDDIVEEIAGSYPALNEETKERILKKCISAYGGESEENGEELTVSGTEPYTRPKWYKYASYVAVAVVAVVGVGSVAMLHRNMNTVDTFDMKNTPVFTEESDDDSTAVATSTTAFNGKTFEGYMAGTATTTAQPAEEVTETTAESSAEKTTEKSTEKSSTPKRTTQPQAETPTRTTETTLSAETVSTETEPTEEISTEADYMEMKTEDITDEELTTEAVINSSAFDSVFVGEKWVCETDTGEFVYEFYDNHTGIFISPDGAEVTRFEYEFGDNFYFVMSFATDNGSMTTKEGEIQNGADKESFIVKWNDGTTQSFYNETVWAGMVN